MPTALALAPLTLAAVLVLSGIAKAQDLGSTASVMRLLRLPAFVQFRGAPKAVVALELVTAALLLTPWRATFAVGAALAVGLFVTFLVVVVRAMGFNPRPTCGCFGRIGDHRINGRTVGRNILLVALALVTAYLAVSGRPTGELLAGYSVNDLIWLLLSVALAAVAVLILGGGQSRPRPSAAVSTQHKGSPARTATEPTSPDPELDYVRAPIPRAGIIAPDYATRSLHQLARSQAQLLVLVNCWCGPTHTAIERLPRWREKLPQLGVQLVIAGEHPFDAEPVQGLSGVWWDPGMQTYDALGSGASPAAVLLGADGLLAGGPVNGIDSIEEFVEDIAAELAEAPEVEAVPAEAPTGD